MNFFEHLNDLYGADLAEQVASDIRTEIEDMVRETADLDYDGVWEEGYRDALHDLALRLTTESEPEAGGSLSRLVPNMGASS
jgi:hypothetical protein